MGDEADRIIQDGEETTALGLDEGWQRMNDGPVHDVPVCDYCGQNAVLVKSSEVYGSGRDYGPMWLCQPCQAWVGCHPGTTRSLGRLANAELRQAKMAAHAAFDPLWRDHPDPPWGRPGHRKSAYTWLADQLGLPPRHCHIGMMGVLACWRVVEACRPFTEKLQEDEWTDLDGDDAVWDE